MNNYLNIIIYMYIYIMISVIKEKKDKKDKKDKKIKINVPIIIEFEIDLFDY